MTSAVNVTCHSSTAFSAAAENIYKHARWSAEAESNVFAIGYIAHVATHKQYA